MINAWKCLQRQTHKMIKHTQAIRRQKPIGKMVKHTQTIRR